MMTVEIRALIQKHCGLPVAVDTLQDDSDLYAAGLTSFASVQLMLALEDRFEIEFPERLLNRRTFSSIASIAKALTEIVPGAEAA